MRRAEPSVAPGFCPPWWLEEAPSDPPAPPLEGRVEADVAIVGGGYTGLWTALALREREPSLRVVLLEAELCGGGPSGRNGGIAHGYWSALGRLRAALGYEDALEVARTSNAVLPALRALGEDIWFHQAGMLKVSASQAQDAAIDRAVAVAAELGVPEEAVPLTGEEVAERCRSAPFRRGVFFRDGATVQPARLVRSLRRAVVAAGVTIHEGTRVTAVRPGLVKSSGGEVDAPEIVLATGAWMTGWKPVRRHLTNFGSYAVLTEPVPELLEEIGWTGGEAIIDGRVFLHYFRTTPDGRVLLGSASGPIGSSGRVDARFTHDRPTAARAEAGLRALLPGIAEARVVAAWGGPIDVSADHVPFFGTAPGTRIHHGVGYSGNGIGPTWLGGQVLASLALGAADDWAALPLVRRRPPGLPPEPLRHLGGRVLRNAMLAVEEAEESSTRRSLAARAIADLPRRLGLPFASR